MFWIIILSFVVLMGLAIAIYLLPSDAPAKKKKEKERRPELIPDPAIVAKQKDWESIAHRWEKQNNGLLGDIEKLKGEQKKILQDLEAQKVQNKELVDKLSLEKSWREKEQVTLEKFKHHEKDFKDQIYRTEQEVEKEHSNRIRLERELQDLKIKHDEVSEEKRQATVKAMSLETSLNVANKELKELRAANAELSRRKEDVQWVAKSEFDSLKLLLQSKEQELARLKTTAGG